MTVLDAHAVLGFLQLEPSAADVAALLRGPTVLTAVNAAEVVDRLVRVHGQDADDVQADLAFLEAAGTNIIAVTPELGVEAGRLRARHYDRQRCAVSMADCVAAATALHRGLALATADPALATVVRSEGGAVHALADSTGVRP